MTDVVERARYCREWGNFDNLHGELLEEVELLRSRETRIRELCESRLKNSASKVIAAIHVSRILAVLDNWAAPVGGSGHNNGDQP